MRSEQARNGQSFRRFLPGILLALVVIFVLFAYGDAREVWAELRAFSWGRFPVALSLVFLSYLLRWAKWHYYVRLLKVPLGWWDSLIVFFGGLVMCITPAKLGEALKAYFVWKMTGFPVARVAPVVLAERFTDLMAMALLASIGVSILPHGSLFLTVVVVCLLAGLGVLSQRWLILRLLAIPRQGRARSVARTLAEAYESAASLLALKRLIFPVLISVPAWGLECVCFDLVTAGFHQRAGLFKSTVFYAFSTLAGAVSLLPGGLALTEGTLTGALQGLCGFPKEKAAAATLMVRICTLWFAFALGVLTCLLWRQRLAGKNQSDLSDSSDRSDWSDESQSDR